MPAALFGILLSAFNSIIGLILRAATIKFVLFTVLYIAIREIVPLLQSSGILPGAEQANSLNTALLGIPSGVWYFLDLMNFPTGLRLVISAYVARFIVRRIPLIG